MAAQQRPQTIRELLAEEIPSLSDVPREVRGALKIPLTRDVSSMHLLSYARAEIDEPISLSQPSKGIRRRKVLLVCTYNTLYVCDEEKGSAITIIPHSEVSELTLLGNGKKGTAGSSRGGGKEACDLSSAPPQDVDEFRNSKDSSLLIQSSSGVANNRSFLALHFSSKASASLKGSASAADMMTLVKTLHDKTHEVLHDSATLSDGSAQEYYVRYGTRRRADHDDDREDSIPSGPLTASAKAQFDNNPAKAMADLTKALAKELADEQGEEDEEEGNSSSPKRKQQTHIIGFGIAQGGTSVRDKLASSIAVVNKAAKCVIELAATSPTKRGGTEGGGAIRAAVDEHEKKKNDDLVDSVGDVDEHDAQEDSKHSKKIVHHIGPDDIDVDDSIEDHGDGGEDASSLCGSLQLQTESRKEGEGGGDASLDEEFPLTPRYPTQRSGNDEKDEEETNESKRHHAHDHPERANDREPLPLRSSSSRGVGVGGDGGEIDNSSLTTAIPTRRPHTGKEENTRGDLQKSATPLQEGLRSQSPSSLLVDPNVLYMELKLKAEADELARKDALEKVLAEAASAALSSKGKGEVDASGDDNNTRHEGNNVDYDPAQQSPYQAIGQVDFTFGPQRSSKTSLNNKSSSLHWGTNKEGHTVGGTTAMGVSGASTISKADKEAAALEAFYKEQAADDERRRSRAAKKAAKLEAKIMEALAKVEAEEERKRKRMMKRRIRGVNRRYERMDMLLNGEIETFEDAVEGLEEEEREEDAAEAAAESTIDPSSAIVGDGRTNPAARVEPQEVAANGNAVAVHVQAPTPAVAFSALAPLRSASSSAPMSNPSPQQYPDHYKRQEMVHMHSSAGGGESHNLSSATASASRTHSHQSRSRGDETASTRHGHSGEATTNASRNKSAFADHQLATNAPFDVYKLSLDRSGLGMGTKEKDEEAFVDAVPQPRVVVDTARPLPMATRVHQAEQSRTLIGKGGGVDPYFYSYGESEARRARPSSVSVPMMEFRDFADRSGVMSLQLQPDKGKYSTGNTNTTTRRDDEYAILKAERDEARRRMALLEEELAAMRQQRRGGGEESKETSRRPRSTAEDRRMPTNNNTNSNSTILPHNPRISSLSKTTPPGSNSMHDEAPPYHLEEEERHTTSNYINYITEEEGNGERGEERLLVTDDSLSYRLAEQRRLTAILSERCFEAASALERSKTSHDASLRQHLFEQQQAYEALLVEHHRALAETRELARDLAKEVAELRGSGGRQEPMMASSSASTVLTGNGSRPHLHNGNGGSGADRLRSLYTPYSNVSQSNTRPTQLYDRGGDSSTSAAFLSQLRSLLSPTSGADDRRLDNNNNTRLDSNSDRVAGVPNASLYGVNQERRARGGGRLGASEGGLSTFGSPFASRVGSDESRNDFNNNNSINTTYNTTHHVSPQGGRGGQAVPRPFSPSSRLSRSNAGGLFATEERRREMLLDL